MDREQIVKKFVQSYTSYKNNIEIFHDLSTFKVKEILLVATFYDGFILEEEGRLAERIFGEYHKLSLPDAPRVTNAINGEEACEWLKKEHFDMVILTMRIDGMSPYQLKEKIRSVNRDIPIVILLNDNGEIPLIKDQLEKDKDKDLVFVWNGDSKVFLAMIKYVEDKKNIERDTLIGNVRVILLVEDSIRYISRYLPILYTEILKQTQRLIIQEKLDDMKKLLRLRARPKVIIATNYEDAIFYFEKYRENLLTVISDMKFPKNNATNYNAGYELIKFIKETMPELPCLLQSFEKENLKKAKELKVPFINKNSDKLSQELRNFIFNNLGFGSFVFKDRKGKEIVKASNIESFRKILLTIPSESLIFHANLNQFSAWLMARGEIKIAKKLQKLKVSDFKSIEDLRKYLIDITLDIDKESIKGKVVKYSDNLKKDEEVIVQIADGTLGGKGRGIAFVNNILQNTDIFNSFENVKITVPKTMLIGSEEFSNFIEKNNLSYYILRENDYNKLRKRFLKGKLSNELLYKLRKKLKSFTKPIAIRSSSLFEDSISQSFSGVFETYMLPNNDDDFEKRMKDVEDAIKLVFSSVFSPSARAYFNAINYKIEEEKMAVIIQEVVGHNYGKYYYPSFSGVMQSDNYYPISHLKREDGICEIAVGLGKYVIDGNDSFRFCPKYPEIDININNKTQKFFYAINLGDRKNFNLIEGDNSTLELIDINVARENGSLNYIGSVLDVFNGTLTDDLSAKGPLVINFNSIIKYEYFPLSKILNQVSAIIKFAIGSPCEIEFAVDLNPDENHRMTFYILQIKPIIRKNSEVDVDIESIPREKILFFSDNAMGNGFIDNINDIILVNPEKFDRMKSVELVPLIEEINRDFGKKGKKYIIVGPGRWGTKDPFLGIPVLWSSISNVKVIVEIEMKDMLIEPSLGSHFFHNVVTMNVFYLTIFSHKRSDSFIDWDLLFKEKNIKKFNDIILHFEFEKPLKVLIDGKRGKGAIIKTD
ncbi:MAG: PEP/pyruvate-binding domain-containing protein [candidate division WOR-3 bacterium]